MVPALPLSVLLQAARQIVFLALLQLRWVRRRVLLWIPQQALTALLHDRSRGKTSRLA